MSEIQIFNREGQRLYLTADEREAFFNASAHARNHNVCTFCRCLECG